MPVMKDSLRRLSWGLLVIVCFGVSNSGYSASFDCSMETADQPINLPADVRIEGLARLWSEAAFGFPYFDQVPDLDWDQAFRSAVPIVLETESCWAYHRELQRFFALLKNNKTRVRYPIRADISIPNIGLSILGGKVFINAIGSSQIAEIPLGSEVVSIDGRDPIELASEEFADLVSVSREDLRIRTAIQGDPDPSFGMLLGLIGTSVEIGFVRPDGSPGKASFRRGGPEQPSPEDVALWLDENENVYRPFVFKWLTDRIAYVYIGTFGQEKVVEVFETKLNELRQAEAIVLDIRGNVGGSTDNAIGILRHLTNKPAQGSLWRTRRVVALDQAIESTIDWESGYHSELIPAPDPVVRPTIVLINTDTISAAEDFLVYADGIDHFRTVGRPTTGSTGSYKEIPLPSGALAMMVVKRDEYPDGRQFVGSGIQPDHYISPTVEDLVTGRDPELEKALELLREVSPP